MAEGNQGYGIDSALVKAKLIEPLDSYAKKYGWDKQFTAGTAQQFRWTPDGNTFGKGNLWGVAQFGQSTGVFYNKALLKKYGGDPNNLPKTFADFESCWRSSTRTRHRVCRSSISATRTATRRCTRSAWCEGAYVSGQFMRNWIFHAPSSDFAATANVKALTTFQKWFKDGYFGSNYNALDENTAAAAFAKGTGVFYLGGNWQAAVIQSGLKSNAGFMNMPPGPSGKYVAIGATSLPWHISSKSKYPDVGAASSTG